jgi:hypothetical protein
MARPQKVLAKIVQLGLGLDLIGSKMSVSNRNAILEVTPLGVKMISRANNRVVLLPWSNIKGVELIPTPEELEE